MPGAAASPASEITLMMCPRPAGRIRSIAASVPFMVPIAFTSSIAPVHLDVLLVGRGR